jgi:rhodanese-related sulfurtransferase
MVKNKLILVALLLCFVSFFMASFASDEKIQTKNLNKKYDNKECKLSKISIIELKKAIEEKSVALVDVNGTKSFAKSHILGSHDLKAEGFAGRLPTNKNELIVVYSSGEQCSADKDACKKCADSNSLREKCSADKDGCDKCAGDKEMRDKCVANKGSIESCDDTKEASIRLNTLGYTNVKCFCAGLKGWIDAGGTTEKE